MPPSEAPAAFACPAPCKVDVDTSRDRAWEPFVVVDPADDRHIVALSGQFRDAPGGESTLAMVAHVSRDAGRTWRSSEVPAPAGSTQVADPVALVLPDGAVLVAGIAWAGQNPQSPLMAPAGTAITTFVVRSEDGGLTYGEPIVVAQGYGATVAGLGVHLPTTDKPWLALGPDGTILLTTLVYDNPSRQDPSVPFGTADIHATSSKDGGRSWSPLRPLPRPDHSPHFASPAIEPDGTWQVAFIDIDFSKNPFAQTFGLWLATSRDEGTTWDAKRIGATPWMPTLRAAAGRLWLAAPFDTGDPAVQPPMLLTSVDQGATWSEPLVLSAPGKGRAMPTVDVDARGIAYVVGYHTHEEEEGPADFRAWRVVDDVPSEPLMLEAGLVGPVDSRGHYIGLSAAAEGAYAVWVSGREHPDYDVAGAWIV